MELISPHHPTTGVDIQPPPADLRGIDVLHVCFPFQIRDFIGETLRYMELFEPALTVINSTVAVGTTRQIALRSGLAVVNSPVRGKHARMLEELSKYKKFVGTIEPEHGRKAAEHFESVGLTTKVLSSPEATELAKLTETTYFGLMIAWAQELERYCDRSGASYDEIISFYEEIQFFPRVKYFPGVIGGHCVMPNIEILRNFEQSDLLEAILTSNERKVERDGRARAESAVGEKETVPA
jgi:UDP-glucose 6-dehydrogenase